jgi:hypothetical protein
MNLKRIRYHTKKCESPKFYNKQDLPYGTFLEGHEKTYRNAINSDIGKKHGCNKLKVTSTR